jgi:hypothetical protein
VLFVCCASVIYMFRLDEIGNCVDPSECADRLSVQFVERKLHQMRHRLHRMSVIIFRRRRRNLQFELLVVPQRFGVRPGVFQQLEHPHLPLPELLVGLRMHEIVQSRRRLPPGVGFAVRLHHLDEQRDAPGLSHGETTLGVGAQRQEGFPHVGVLLAAQHRQQTVHHVHLGLELLGGAARQAGTPQKGPAGARRETHHAGQFRMVCVCGGGRSIRDGFGVPHCPLDGPSAVVEHRNAVVSMGDGFAADGHVGAGASGPVAFIFAAGGVPVGAARGTTVAVR